MEENSGPTDKKATDKTPTIKIGDSTYVRKDAIGWVDKKDKTNTPVSPAMARVLDQGVEQAKVLPVEDKGLDQVKADLSSLESTVKTGDQKEQESLLTLIDRVKELNATTASVSSGVEKLGDKLKQDTGHGGPNDPPMSPKDQIESIKLSIGELLNAAIKGAIGEGSRSGGKFMETYNQLRAVPQIEKDPETGKYINKLTGKEHGEADYKEEQEKYANRPGRLVSAATAGVAGIGKYFQGVGERLDPTGIVRRFNDIKQNNIDQIKANEYEQKRVAGLPDSGTSAAAPRQPDAKPVLNTGDHMSAQAGVRVTDISQNVITRLADAISKAIKGDAPPPAEPEEVAKDSMPVAANDNMHPDATKVPDETGDGLAAGLGGILEGIASLWGMLKKVVSDAFEGFMKFGKKIAGEAPEFIGKLWSRVQEVIGDLMGKIGKIFESLKNGITGLFKGGEKIAGDVVKGGEKIAGDVVKGGEKIAGDVVKGGEGLLKGGRKAAGGLAEGAGGIVKGAVKSVGGVAEGAGKAFGAGGKVAGKVGGKVAAKGAGRLFGSLVPGIGVGIDAYSSAEAYKNGNNLAGGLYAAGGALNAIGATADLSGFGVPAGIVADVAGFGLTGAGMAAEFFGDPFAKKKPANVPVKPSVVPKTAAVAGMTNKNAAMKDQAASSKSSSPIISSDNSSKTTVINNNSNMSMMLPTAADRGSLRLATYT